MRLTLSETTNMEIDDEIIYKKFAEYAINYPHLLAGTITGKMTKQEKLNFIDILNNYNYD